LSTVNLGKAFRAALHPEYWPAMARVVVPTIEHAPALASVEPATVIDVGANKGQFSSFAASRWPHAAILAFEPLPRPAARYRRVLGERATLFNCALGAEEARLEMHVASRDDSSSLLSLGERQKTVFHMDEVATLSVDVKRLDKVLDGRVAAPALLKIDVQGYEYEVLQGIGELTRQIEWIYVETSFVELYTGQRLHDEVAALLEGLGYELTLEHNATMDKGQKVQADVLFRKRPASNGRGA
jgi:FkbM family methyltransferase